MVSAPWGRSYSVVLLKENFGFFSACSRYALGLFTVP